MNSVSSPRLRETKLFKFTSPVTETSRRTEGIFCRRPLQAAKATTYISEQVIMLSCISKEIYESN